MADDILRQGVQGITDLITTPGQINLDFADVRTVMSDAGSAMMGVGTASGENRAAEAAKMAISSPLMEESIEGATGMLLNFTGSDDLNLFDAQRGRGHRRLDGRQGRQHHLRHGDRRQRRRRGP